MSAAGCGAAQAGRDCADELGGRLLAVARGYQQMLAREPHNAEALTGLSLVALASQQTAAAVKMAAAGVAAAPVGSALQGTAWVALGQALKADGRGEAAAQAYEQALRQNGLNTLARVGLGELRLAAGEAEAAAQEFQRALQQQPTLATAQMGMGSALALMERNEEALEWYERALAVRPRFPEALFGAGFVLARLGRTREAEARYRRAVATKPGFAAAWMNLGSLLREQGQDLWAEAALQRAVELRPDMLSGWIHLAALERERKRPAEAEKYLRTALKLNPEQAETLLAWCQFRLGEQDRAGAWEWLRWARAREPENAEALNMEGILLHTGRRFAEAVEVFARAEEFGSRSAASNRGNALLELGRMDEALRAQEVGVVCDPLSAGAQYNLALTQLRLGRWQEGWQGYEARWQFHEVHPRPRRFAQPRWAGEELRGERVLLHAEQGLGDTIQFCRYAALVAARGGVPVLQVQAPVERLMRSLAVVRAGLAETALLEVEPPSFDLECPLMSLPAVFATAIDTVPWPGAYLGADLAEVQEKQEKFPTLRPGLRVGLAWAGNPKYKADAIRSTRLETLVPLLRVPGCTWISLQKGKTSEQLAGLPGHLFVWDGASGDRDLAEAAALVATLDLVITTDTCIAHLAGAMGKPVWILLPHLADWRWMEQTETTPWYPTARLLRQARPGDWAGLVARAIAELKGFQRAHGPVPAPVEAAQRIPA